VNVTRSYALNRLAINLGWAIGSGVGGMLADIDPHLLFYVDGVTNIIAGMLILFFLKPVNFKDEMKKQEVTGKAPSAYKDKIFLVFIVLTFFFASCFFQLFTNFYPFFYQELHYSKTLIGYLLAMNGIIIAIIEMVLIHKLDGKRKNLHYISFGIFLCGLAFLMLNIPGIGLLLAFLMICLMTFGEIFSMPFMNSFWISRTRPGNRGQYAALFTMAWSAAQTLGPLGGSQLADYFGFKWLWFSAAAICVIVAVLIRRLEKTNSFQSNP
jgi:predicted MFS family arabinose efflux permease